MISFNPPKTAGNNPSPEITRDLQVETLINKFRLAFILVIVLITVIFELFPEGPHLLYGKNIYFLGFLLLLIPILLGVHRFIQRTVYLERIKYITVTIDFVIGLVLTFLIFLNRELLLSLTPRDLSLSLSFIFVFINSLSVLRLNKSLVYYSAVLTLLINLFIYASQDGLLLFGLYTSAVIALLSLFNLWVISYLLDYWSVNNELRKAYNELQMANENINLKNEEITTQSEQIVKHLETLESIQKDHTDSLHYAQKIQKALINNEILFKNFFDDYFIMLKPKSLVTGDFYWVSNVKGKLIIAVSDCTGHGVPGAFMTMLGYSYLNEIVNKEHITEPDKILNELRQIIIESLHQDGKIYEQKDGMDMAIVQVDKEAKKIKFSAANNSLCYIPTRVSPEDKKVYEFKGDRMPISFHYKMRHFSLLEFDIRKGDKFYLYTDGYIDQFGGPKGKKFKSVPFRRMLLKNHNLSMSEQKDILENKMEDWLRGLYEQVDDITVIGFEV